MIPTLLVLLLAGSLSGAEPTFAGIPIPPGAVPQAELTKAATARAQVEVKAALARLEKDPSIPAAQKGEVRRKIERLKLAVYTTDKSLDETVSYYESSIAAANFLFGERGLVEDAQEVARARGFTLPAATIDAWSGKRGRSARWSSDDGAMEVDVEDHLVDPRDGTITKKTVILLTSTQ